MFQLMNFFHGLSNYSYIWKNHDSKSTLIINLPGVAKEKISLCIINEEIVKLSIEQETYKILLPDYLVGGNECEAKLENGQLIIEFKIKKEERIIEIK